ncbi:STE/STE20 protein kinase [Edhazardia aedis USNM 41457]|uniref:non-specific serine/threonine protein kinase n=1 Tax=Edhazardia aedis (strain USNM 41457) TaxID=1003232 RepID=J9DI57_EDHAE|nr:STE/STE20 protein kinase [Edhazardia aedis USNM 41457]|eukprot:EJW02310.1 STE/STE20 protein kinase [Edhazardia aedis USNM 41457]
MNSSRKKYNSRNILICFYISVIITFIWFSLYVFYLHPRLNDYYYENWVDEDILYEKILKIGNKMADCYFKANSAIICPCNAKMPSSTVHSVFIKNNDSTNKISLSEIMEKIVIEQYLTNRYSPASVQRICGKGKYNKTGKLSENKINGENVGSYIARKIFNYVNKKNKKSFIKLIGEINKTIIYEIYKKGKKICLKRSKTLATKSCGKYDIAKQLDHKNILKVYDFIIENRKIDKGNEEICWSFSEKMDFDLIKKKGESIDEDNVKNIIKDIALGLKYLHSKNIAHLDVKIENIMGKKEGNKIVYKLIDLEFLMDLSKYKGNKKYMGDCFYGTFTYVSPEIMLHNVFITKSDIWSLGITTWNLLKKNDPFNDSINGNRKYLAFLINEKNLPIEFEDHVSPLARNFINFCLERNAMKRPDINEVLKHPFLSKEQ